MLCVFTALSGLAFNGLGQTFQVTIQPIQVFKDAVTGDPFNLNEVATDKIWSQASIDINYLPLATVINPQAYDVGLDGFPGLQDASYLWGAPAAAVGRNDGTVNGKRVINLWFVNSINQTGVALHGYTERDEGIVVSKAGINAGILGLIANELGHALGLSYAEDTPPGGLPAVPTTRLMRGSGNDTTSLAEVFPNGAGFYELISTEITTARSSRNQSFYLATVPEPAYAGLAFGVALTAWAFWRRRSASATSPTGY